MCARWLVGTVRVQRTPQTRTTMCLPHPHKLDTYYLNKIYSTFAVVLAMTVFAGYTNRLKRLVCALFFRKREKRRVLYLYNETLRRRTAFFRYMKLKVEKLARENKLSDDFNVCLVLRLRFPRAFGWLVWFACARRRCLICGEPESRAGGKRYGCDTVGCVYVHCEQCWTDVGVCYGCSELFRRPAGVGSGAADRVDDDDADLRGYVDTGYSD